eukprot:4112874-Pyramimonas_sp.AAC.1
MENVSQCSSCYGLMWRRRPRTIARRGPQQDLRRDSATVCVVRRVPPLSSRARSARNPADGPTRGAEARR